MMPEKYEPEEFRYSKSISETYHLSVPGSLVWANITINSSGDLNIQSNYGNYQYAWRSFGEDFKKFLIHICTNDPSFLYNKLHNRSEANRIDVMKTVNLWKREVIRWFRETLRFRRLRIDRDEARSMAKDAMKALDAIVQTLGPECQAETFYVCARVPEINQVIDFEWSIYEGSPVTMGDHRCQALIDEIMPAFASILQRELEEKERTHDEV